MDYNETLNLPKTSFPMKANLPSKEPEILKFWDEIDINALVLDKNKDKPKYILHDGPPYANGDLHLGHTLNKILKDIINKYKSMRGYNTPYVPGWDTHGLPIEAQAIKKLGINKNEINPVEFRKMCRQYALEQVDIQREEFKRLGVRGDWDHPYLTLNPEFEAKQIEIFGQMAEKGYIYKGLKPVYWCTTCETALAEAEIEYKDETADSIYVKFGVTDDRGLFRKLIDDISKIYFVIWTTTTWTIPANLAISLNPEFDYSLVAANGEVYVMATELVKSVLHDLNISEYKILGSFKGQEMEGIKTKHPLYDRDSVIIVGDHVTLDTGTGCVHTAPGHGEEDFIVGQKYGLPAFNPVDEKGFFKAEAGKYAGMKYYNANREIEKDLAEAGALLGKKKILHSYPHCWRCKNPVIFRATEQWFASVKGFREEALKAIKEVEWVPEWGEERITNMVKDREDWCISRQRLWGVPIPIFYCQECGEALIDKETIAKISDIFREKGSDAWFEMSPEELLPEGKKCRCGSTNFRKETDIMDVWFDSGSTHAAVLETRDDLRWPADMYLEGSDQHRGWFQSSLLTSVATRGKAPYRSVLTHGFVVDGEGRKMSKSLGNGIDPDEIIKKYGAEILRLWVISSDYTSDVRISDKILGQLTEVYKKIRNTIRFMLGNLYDFDPDKDMVGYQDMEEIDKWALLRLERLKDRINDAYEGYQYHLIYHLFHNFCVVDMSNQYLDIIKDRLYTFKANSKERRSAQTALYIILNDMIKLIAPVLSFTTEEAWGYMPHRKDENYESVQLTDWPEKNEDYIDIELEDRWNKIMDIRGEVTRALEIARNSKIIGHSLNAEVTLYPSDDIKDTVNYFYNKLDTIFIVSKVNVCNYEDAGDDITYETESLKIKVQQAPGQKCSRCWVYSETVGQDPEHPDLCHKCITNL
ncbi:isoleucine--tRNA ligase [Calorimonas adulescens]|uniref:Isoleucine--tRNA ligase n=1 Tax=Calorimonas adulescens TaxID=2606906 RepID=A0A5D8QBW1_9THEO|nr:isoleucine--tRNA ligase [Calorimonas adulescens]TZE82021.1 isoleucine--tRNA ligase [Calorimonas adulescens]